MDVKLKLTMVLILALASTVTRGQRIPLGPVVLLRGQIVRYDWVLHETSLYDDFVIRKAPDENGKASYVRIFWLPPMMGWEGPNPLTQHLDRLAFVQTGPPWLFSVRSLESGPCPKVPNDPELQDETGKHKIPRYFAAPGAEGESVPPINTLPCFQLQKPMSQDKQQSAQHAIDPKTGNPHIEIPVIATPTTH
jgi:hypothetical protein